MIGLLYQFDSASVVASNEQLLINADGTRPPSFFSKSTYIENKIDFFNLLDVAMKVFYVFSKQAQSYY